MFRFIPMIFILIFVLFNSIQSQPIFDLRDTGTNDYISPVKQQKGGTCWTHGAMSAIESNLMITGKWAELGMDGEPDLAEYHLDWWNGFNLFCNDDVSLFYGDGLEVHFGGDYLVTAAYIARGDGPIMELSEDTYSNPPEKTNNTYKYFYVRDIEWYDVQLNFNKISAIKQAIKTHGAIGTAMCASGLYIDENFIHHQPNSSTDEPNHAIAIVGWNDTIVTPAKFTGAWLCKNSWGTGYGLDGYFWISYYDKVSIRHPEMGAVSFTNTEEMKYSTIYSHDYHGWRDEFSGAEKVFNKFYATSQEDLSAVSFYTPTDNNSCTINIYDDFSNGSLTNLLEQKQIFISKKGFHTIDLDSPVQLEENGDFYIEVEMSSKKYAYDRTSEIPVLLGVESPDLTIVPSKSNPGESFYYSNGEWHDFYEINHTANFCIKGLTTVTTDIEEDIKKLPSEYFLKQNYPNPFNPSTKIEFVVPERSFVRLFITDILGSEVKVLFEGDCSPGKYASIFDGENIASGIYFYHLLYKNRTITKKMVLLK